MKKLILILLILPCLAFSQHKGHIEGTIYLSKNITIELNQELVAFLTANLTIIESIDGKTVINIPIARDYKKNRRSRIIEGYFCQYEWVIYPDRDEVILDDIKTTYLEFDFDKDNITQKHKDNDDDMFDKPDDLKDKIKSKDKEKPINKRR
jgi:hypothetical protein